MHPRDNLNTGTIRFLCRGRTLGDYPPVDELLATAKETVA